MLWCRDLAAYKHDIRAAINAQYVIPIIAGGPVPSWCYLHLDKAGLVCVPSFQVYHHQSVECSQHEPAPATSSQHIGIGPQAPSNAECMVSQTFNSVSFTLYFVNYFFNLTIDVRQQSVSF